MLCKEIRPLVEKLADGECTKPERQRVEAHLADCESCQQHLQVVKTLTEAARKVPVFEPPDAYWEVLPQKVMARIGRMQTGGVSRGGFFRSLTPARIRWIGALAAGVIAVVLSYEVLTLEQKVAPSVGIKPEGESEPEKAADETTPTMSDVVSGKADKSTDRDRLDSAGTPPRQAPTPSSEEEGIQSSPRPPPPVRRDLEAPALPANQPNRDETAKAAPSVLDEARRVEPPAEAEVATPITGMAEESRRPPQPPGQPLPSKLEASSPSSSKPYAIQTDAGRGEESKESLAEERASELLPKVARAVRDEKDRRRARVSEPGLEAECGALREARDSSAEADERGDYAYRLALCSIRLYRALGTEDAKLQARQDAYGYLDVHSRGERADEIRRLLQEAGIQK